VDLCLADGTTNQVVNYSGTGQGTAMSNGEAMYIANTNARAAADADLAGQRPAGATDGACAAPVTELPAATSVPEEATVPVSVPVPGKKPAKKPQPAAVTVPQAAILPQAVNAGGGSSSGENGPNGALLALTLVASLVAVGAAGRLVATRIR
jgi:hypothetical protein